MPYTPVPVERFSGLDLITDPRESDRAVDLMNVDLRDPSRLRTRPGYGQFNGAVGFTPTAGVQYGSQFVTVSGVGATGANAFNAAGTSLATQTTSKWASAVRVGTAATAYVYVGATASGLLYRWDGSSWAASLASVAARFLTVTPWDSRLIALAGDTARFSDPDDPETFDVSNFVQLTPGDNEAISGAVAWRDLVIIGKQSRLFVFYSTSTDVTGGAIFNYRTIDAGIGPISSGTAETTTMAAGRSGVYFLGADGVYVTTGDVPQKISVALDPWFRGETLPFWTGSTFTGAFTKATVGCVGDYVYVSPEPGVSALTFVYHVPTSSWTAYDWAMTCCVPYSGTGVLASPMIAVNTQKLYKHLTSSVTDSGTAITWRHRSGQSALGFPMQEKIVRQTRLSGQGSVTVTRYKDDETSDSNAGSVTLGTGATASATHLKSWRGTLMSLKLSGSGQCEVSSVEHDVRNVRPVGIRTA